MLLQNYLNQIKTLIEQYANIDFVLTAELAIEPRREEQAYLRGQVIFQDESSLYFTEYLLRSSMAEPQSRFYMPIGQNRRPTPFTVPIAPVKQKRHHNYDLSLPYLLERRPIRFQMKCITNE